MKKYIFYMLAAVFALAACEKNTFKTTEHTYPDGFALLKVGLFTMDSIAKTQLVYNNGVRISSPFASPYPYPGGGYNTGGGTGGDYFKLNAGVNKFEFYTTNQGTYNLVSKLFETTQTLEANKKYTLYVADTATSKAAVLAPDNGTTPVDSGFANIRFINLVPNSTAVDFYQNNTLLKGNIKYKEFTDFFNMPSGVADTFSIRIAGSAPGPAIFASAYYRLAINTNKRILSFISRGYLGVVDATRKANVSVAVNQ
ncbi:MAG: DUF4397 domain-containing protein [Ferruginibacter sp.]